MTSAEQPLDEKTQALGNQRGANDGECGVHRKPVEFAIKFPQPFEFHDVSPCSVMRRRP